MESATSILTLGLGADTLTTNSNNATATTTTTATETTAAPPSPDSLIDAPAVVGKKRFRDNDDADVVKPITTPIESNKQQQESHLSSPPSSTISLRRQDHPTPPPTPIEAPPAKRQKPSSLPSQTQKVVPNYKPVYTPSSDAGPSKSPWIPMIKAPRPVGLRMKEFDDAGTPTRSESHERTYCHHNERLPRHLQHQILEYVAEMPANVRPTTVIFLEDPRVMNPWFLSAFRRWEWLNGMAGVCRQWREWVEEMGRDKPVVVRTWKDMGRLAGGEWIRGKGKEREKMQENEVERVWKGSLEEVEQVEEVVIWMSTFTGVKEGRTLTNVWSRWPLWYLESCLKHDLSRIGVKTIRILAANSSLIYHTIPSISSLAPHLSNLHLELLPPLSPSPYFLTPHTPHHHLCPRLSLLSPTLHSLHIRNLPLCSSLLQPPHTLSSCFPAIAPGLCITPSKIPARTQLKEFINHSFNRGSKFLAVGTVTFWGVEGNEGLKQPTMLLSRDPRVQAGRLWYAQDEIWHRLESGARGWWEAMEKVRRRDERILRGGQEVGVWMNSTKSNLEECEDFEQVWEGLEEGPPEEMDWDDDDDGDLSDVSELSEWDNEELLEMRGFRRWENTKEVRKKGGREDSGGGGELELSQEEWAFVFGGNDVGGSGGGGDEERNYRLVNQNQPREISSRPQSKEEIEREKMEERKRKFRPLTIKM